MADFNLKQDTLMKSMPLNYTDFTQNGLSNLRYDPENCLMTLQKTTKTCQNRQCR
jgi:hypothetical protein